MYHLFRDGLVLRDHLDDLILIEFTNRSKQRLEADIAPVSANFELTFSIIPRFN